MIPFGQGLKRNALLVHLFHLCGSTNTDKNRKFAQTGPAETVQHEQTKSIDHFSST